MVLLVCFYLDLDVLVVTLCEFALAVVFNFGDLCVCCVYFGLEFTFEGCWFGLFPEVTCCVLNFV